jgi:uncharacterized protein involved in outer membrane biogenesis
MKIIKVIVIIIVAIIALPLLIALFVNQNSRCLIM